MFFSIKVPKSAISLSKYYAITMKRNALLKLSLIVGNIKYANFSKYFLNNYNKILSLECRKLISSCYVWPLSDSEIIIKFPQGESSNMAKLIMFGDGKIKGIDILSMIFS